MIIVILILFTAVTALEVPPLIKKKEWRDLVFYSLLMALALGLSIAYVFQWPIPNPTAITNKVFMPIGEIVDKMLQN